MMPINESMDNMKYQISMAIIVLIRTYCACNLSNETGYILIGCFVAALLVVNAKGNDEFKDELNKEE